MSKANNDSVLTAGTLGVSALVYLLNNGENGSTETSQSLLGRGSDRDRQSAWPFSAPCRVRCASTLVHFYTGAMQGLGEGRRSRVRPRRTSFGSATAGKEIGMG